MSMPKHPNTDLAKAVFDHLNSGADSDQPLWDAHYDPNFSSVEADGTTHTGLEEVKGKHEWWYGAHTVHAFKATDYYMGPNGFSIRMEMDVEPKDGSWPRMKMTEMGVYTVENGKVVREEFHAPPMG